MKAICEPSYANIFMEHFERKFIFPFLQGLLLMYLRFIDYIYLCRQAN